MTRGEIPLLAEGDPQPVWTVNAGSTLPFLILCDHAGRDVPRALGDLGVSAPDWERHIAWDIGAGAVTRLLSARLGAAAIGQNFSRLVIDCNRAPGHPTSIPTISDFTQIPGNVGLSPGQAAARADAIFWPYQNRIGAELDRRHATGQRCAVIAMHSFTPVFGGQTRLWQAGVLHNRHAEFAIAVGEALRRRGYHVGDNEPYQLSDDSDYTIPVHAEARGLPYVELEIRQDLIAEPSGQAIWAATLSEILSEILPDGAAGGD